jgi:predicted GNAT family acetyltransferase
MDLERHADAEAFLDRAGPFLAAREAEHNLIFGICSALIADPGLSAGPPYFATVAADGSIVAAMIQTPPRNAVLSEVDDPAALDLLVEDLARMEPAGREPGVVGPAEHAVRFAERWTSRTGRPNRIALRERIFRLTSVHPPPRPSPGAMRIATTADRDILVAWYRAFLAEALGEDETVPDAVVTVDRWLAGDYRTLYLWEAAGVTVSWCGVGGRTPNGIRIGPVYTPPEHRNRGYASALVAEASQAQLDAGIRFCFLFTDLANPTSNHIYQAIGYEPIRDVDAYHFD